MTTPAPKPEDKPADKSKDLVVTAPLVRVEDEGGRLIYLYRGAPLKGVKQSEVERLIDLEMVGEGDENVMPGVAEHPEFVKTDKSK